MGDYEAPQCVGGPGEDGVAEGLGGGQRLLHRLHDNTRGHLGAGQGRLLLTFSPIWAILSANSFLSSDSMMDWMGVPRIDTPYLTSLHKTLKD